MRLKLVCIFSILLCQISNALAQTTYQFTLDTSILHFVSLPTPVGGKYLATDYSTISKPLVVEHFKTNCQILKNASTKHSNAGNVSNVLFGGDLPAGAGNPACVTTVKTFNKSDFPICLETNVYSENTQPQYNEAYFWIGPADYEYFSSATYNYNGEYFQKEGVGTGGFPHVLYVDNHRSSSQSSVSVTQKTHNLSSWQKWYNLRVILDFSGNDLIIKSVYVNKTLVNASPITVSNVPFLSNFRLALCIDDLVEGFKIVLNYKDFSVDIVADDTTICEGDQVDYSAKLNSTSDPSITYNWTFDGGNPTVSSANAPGKVLYSKAGYYKTTLIAQKGAVSDTAIQWISVQAKPKKILGRDTTLCAESFIVTPLQTFDKYLWNDNSVTAQKLVMQSGMYSVTITKGACVVMDTILVDLQGFKLNLGSDTALCFSQNHTLISNVDADTFLWSNGSNQKSISINKDGTYWVWAKKGLCESADTIVIASAETIVLNLGLDQQLCLGQKYVIDLNLPDGVIGKWSNGFKGNIIEITESGTYIVSVNACEKLTASVNIEFEDCCHIWIPNAFSPNIDALNDQFKVWMSNPGCEHIAEFEFKVYDLWGGLIYCTTDKNQGWNGKIHGVMAPLGAYVWMATWHDGFMYQRRKGTVTLLR